MTYGCPERKYCWMADFSCYLSQRYLCPCLDTVLELRKNKEMKLIAEQRVKEKSRVIEDLDYILQMEIGCI